MIFSDNRFVQIGLLLDYYESVISKKQFDALDMYYNKDMSLSEIGENLGITRQGVYEILKRGEEKLFYLEEKLHCYELTKTCEELKIALANSQEANRISNSKKYVSNEDANFLNDTD